MFELYHASKVVYRVGSKIRLKDFERVNVFYIAKKGAIKRDVRGQRKDSSLNTGRFRLYGENE